MGPALRKLTDMVASENRHKKPWSELRQSQISAADERFQERIEAISLLKHRAETAGIEAIRSESNLVPLLFAHTTFKSYPENWLIEEKWDRLGGWLDTVATAKIENIDTKEVIGLDDWLERLKGKGHFVSCSSGTTGKCSMILASQADRDFIRRYAAEVFTWTTGVPRGNEYYLVGTTPMTMSPRGEDSRATIADAFCDGPGFRFPGKPITIGQVSKMVALRRRMMGGTATPGELEVYEATSAERQEMVEAGVDAVVDAMIEARGRKLMIGGMFAGLYPVAQKVRARGYSGKDFHPENVIQVAGGLKGTALPSDYRQYILETFNIAPERIFQYYSMQEINSPMPLCRARRYHVPPWLMLLLLDDTGEKLIEPREGDLEGRAGFMDLSIDGRWGGVITGDKVSVNYGKCECGHEGPTVAYDINRYSDLVGGDKISCSGTIEAYVRGVS